jgi:hypothetical protein
MWHSILSLSGAKSHITDASSIEITTRLPSTPSHDSEHFNPDRLAMIKNATQESSFGRLSPPPPPAEQNPKRAEPQEPKVAKRAKHALLGNTPNHHKVYIGRLPSGIEAEAIGEFLWGIFGHWHV